MFSRHGRVVAASILGGVAAILVACSEAPQAPLAAPHARPAFNSIDGGGSFKICKASETAGSFTFELTRSGGGDGIEAMPTTKTITITTDGGDHCSDAFFATNAASWTTPITITVHEIVPTGMKVCNTGIFKNGSLQGDYTITNPASVTFGFADNASVEMANCNAPLLRMKGCTPGYWKQDQHFDSWPAGVTPSQLLSTYFVTAPLALNGKALGAYTMLEGLKMKGGSGIPGASQILMRASVAAYVNARKGLGYQYTTAQVVSLVNAAIASGNRASMILTASELDQANNAGCTLN